MNSCSNWLNSGDQAGPRWLRLSSVLLIFALMASCTSYSPPINYSVAQDGATGLVVERTPSPGCGVFKILFMSANFYVFVDGDLVARAEFCKASSQFVSLQPGKHRLRIDATEISPGTLWREVLNGDNKATFNIDDGQTGYLRITDSTSREWVGGREEYSTNAVFSLSGVNNIEWE